MTAYKSILVPIDGSENSTKALHEALDLAKLTNAKITVINVVDLNMAFSTLRGADFNIHFIESFESAGHGLLESAKKTLAGYADAEFLLYKGDPAHILVREIEKRKPDIVVLAGRSKGKIQQILLGSVAHYLLTHTTCPILIVR